MWLLALSAHPHHSARASLLSSQNQRAFQKQDNIFVGKKRVVGAKKATVRETRYYKSVGLGIKTPRSAIEGTYVDKKCPWTGSVNIRGKFMTGVIKTAKMKNTVIIRKVRAATAPRHPRVPQQATEGAV